MRSILSLSLLLTVTACVMPGGSEQRAYLVFFNERSPALDAAASGVVAKAAAIAKRHPAAQVIVHGYTGTAGSPRADIVLSDERAKAVANQLVADGIAPDRIVSQGRGQTDQFPGVASRRVDIEIRG